MGKTKKSEAVGNIKGQKTLNCFFAKKPPGGQSKLFTQVQPGARTIAPPPVTSKSFHSLLKSTDDSSDFQPQKTSKSPNSPNVKLTSSKGCHQSKERHLGSHRGNHKGKTTFSKLPKTLLETPPRKVHYTSDSASKNIELRQPSNVSLVQVSKTKLVQDAKGNNNSHNAQASSFHDNTNDLNQGSQGSQITVIPETPEAVLNSKKTHKVSAPLPDDDLTPHRNLKSPFSIFVPETPTSAGHPQQRNKSISRLRNDSNSKKLSRKPDFQNAERFSSRTDKITSLKSLKKNKKSCLEDEGTDLLAEMLQEFAESSTHTPRGGKRLTTHPELPLGVSWTPATLCETECNHITVEANPVSSTLNIEQKSNINTSDAIQDSSDSYVARNIFEAELPVIVPQTEKQNVDLTAGPPTTGLDLKDNIKQTMDPLEEMLQEYSSLASSLAINSDKKIPSRLKAKSGSLGERQVFRARRPSSKLSRTFRKNSRNFKLGPSPAKNTIQRDHDESLILPNVDQNTDDLNSVSSAEDESDNDTFIPSSVSLEEDLFASATKKKIKNPFAVKPSKIKLKAMGSNQQSKSQSTTAAQSKLNMRKRSPTKGSSPYAKRLYTSGDKQTIESLSEMIKSPLSSTVKDSSRCPPNRNTQHIGSSVKKSLFQQEKENLYDKVDLSPSRSSTSPQKLTDKTNIEIYTGTESSNMRKQNSRQESDEVKSTASDKKINIDTWASLPTEDSDLNVMSVPTDGGRVSSSQPNIGNQPSHGADELWDGELNDSLLAAMDMDYFGNDGMSEEKLESLETKVTRDFSLLSPFKSSSQQKEISLPVDLNRYKVIGIQDTGSEKLIQLMCLTKHKQKSCKLTGSWFNTLLHEGDVVAVHGKFDSSGMCTVDQQKNFLVVHPDLLLTGTNVSRSIRCMRRSLLSDKFKGLDCASKPMLLGTMLHEVFDKAVETKNFSEENLLKVVDKVSHRLPYLIDMYAIGMTEQNVLQDAQEYIGTMKRWAARFLQPHPKQSATVDIKMPGQNQTEKFSVCVSRIQDIEETVWSPRWGTKGKVDLTVEVKIHPQRSQGSKHQMTVPLELKTGRQTNSIEHRSQLVLYSLMLGDIHSGASSDLGMLLYLKTGAMMAVPATHMDKRELIHLRNQLAYYLSLQAKLSNDGGWTLPKLPDPIEDSFTCGHCAHAVSCSLLQGIESDQGLVSDLSETGRHFFAEQINHLSSAHAEYFKHWHLLCALENIASEKRNQTKHIWCTDALEREERGGGNCLSSLQLAGCKHNKTQESFHISFKRQQGHQSRSMLDFQVSQGDRVAVSVEGTRKVATCTGFIESIGSEEVTIKADRPLVSTQSKPVYRMDKDDAYNNMASSLVNLAKLMHNDENACRLCKLVVDLNEPQFDSNSQVPESAKKKVADILGSLNTDQQRAINAVLRCQDYSLIIGMPGTGKTTTIVALVRILCACNLSVLLTSYTHSAVDNILLKLIKFGISPLRLGSEHRVHSDLRSYSERAVLGTSRSVQQLASCFETKLVVATTCLGAKHTLLTRRTFDVCIVDEASQISQLVCLGPLFRARRFVLVGDHKQLPPLVQSNAARQLGMSVSLFQRLGERHESTPSAAVQLSLQYRMNSDIMKLSNTLVYEGRLRCGNEAVATAKLNLPNWKRVKMELTNDDGDNSWLINAIQPSTPVCFLTTDKVKFPDEADEKHTVNKVEALLVQRLVNCLKKCGCAQSDIGIISPYRNQCKLLGTMLDEHIEVNTVDKYQGRDKEVIIVSFTAKDVESGSGFLLEDLRRLNVALTRAKHKLILIGCIKALSKYGPMRQLLEYLQSTNMMVTLPSDVCSKSSQS
ncbi:DNA replication ATP-dependent helicase/nuclease DNA2-like [Asterias amurensis]|uniref:DNA replication ATP-dependent helicase/nuclease DNA2-like n=1 Tax=Asterias amurensis TaxID=7602 RepID=UPI003AB5D4D7